MSPEYQVFLAGMELIGEWLEETPDLSLEDLADES
jgi:hypothetical protein